VLFLISLVQYEASPLNKISNLKIDDVDGIMENVIEQGAAVAELVYKQAESLSNQIKKNANRLPAPFALFDFDGFKRRMEDRKQRLSNYLETFKPKFQKNLDLTIEFLKSAKSSNKDVDQARLDAVDSVKSLGEAVSGAVDGLKQVLSEKDVNDNDDDNEEDDE
jgi:hypothetical protein